MHIIPHSYQTHIDPLQQLSLFAAKGHSGPPNWAKHMFNKSYPKSGTDSTYLGPSRVVWTLAHALPNKTSKNRSDWSLAPRCRTPQQRARSKKQAHVTGRTQGPTCVKHTPRGHRKRPPKRGDRRAPRATLGGGGGAMFLFGVRMKAWHN